MIVMVNYERWFLLIITNLNYHKDLPAGLYTAACKAGLRSIKVLSSFI